MKVRIQDDEAEVDVTVRIEGTLDTDAWTLVKAADKAVLAVHPTWEVAVYDEIYIKADTRKGNTRKIVTDWRDGHEMPTRYSFSA